MTGSDLYDYYQQAGATAPSDSSAVEYAQLLRTALFVVEPADLYAALEQAEATGQQIDLTYPVPIGQGPSEPDGIQLVAATS